MRTLDAVEVQRWCKEYRDVIRNLALIHVEIDAPTRKVGADEPELVFRLRKVCHHALAIAECTINVDGVHVMTTELRAAYEQMDVVWKCLPDKFRVDEDGKWWTNEAEGRLAAYNHPTMANLAFSLSSGGFGEAEAPESYIRLALWMGRLGCAYALALAYLARVLGTHEDIESRLDAVLRSCTHPPPGPRCP